MNRFTYPTAAVLWVSSLVSAGVWAQTTAQFPSDLPTINTLSAAPAVAMQPPSLAPVPMQPMQAQMYPSYPQAYAPPAMMRPMPYYGYPIMPQPYAMYNPYMQQRMPYPVQQQPATTQPYYASPYNPAIPATPGPKQAAPKQQQVKKPKKAWGDTRYIWPDFYTDTTNDMWDKMINAPYNMGRMPGGWRFPSLSVPDPVTVGDAVTNQLPPIAEEVPNFMNFTR